MSPAVALGIQLGLAWSSMTYTTTAVSAISCATWSAITRARAPTSCCANKVAAISAIGTVNAGLRVAMSGVRDCADLVLITGCAGGRLSLERQRFQSRHGMPI